MSTADFATAESPLLPVYPFNAPGQAITLYNGPIGGLESKSVPGVVELSCDPRLRLEWYLKPDAPLGSPPLRATVLKLRRPVGEMSMAGVPYGFEDGWSNGAVFGRTDAPLNRIIAHWFNLPRWSGQIDLTAATEDGGQQLWSGGRWVHEADGWKITVDVRPDHRQVWTDLHKSDVFVMTHVMELRRSDGASFTADEAEPVLSALHVGVSFALGRWAAPALPVGQNADGDIVWEQWSGLHCDPARAISPGWWYEQDHGSLSDLLGRVIKAFADPNKRIPLDFQLKFAVAATGDRGYLEQRITTGMAGLEHVMWQTLVIDGPLSSKEFRSPNEWPAERRLRTVLEAAQIPVGVDASLLPVIARFVAEQGSMLDGADVVTQIRNRMLHPKGAQEKIYKLDGLTTEAWLLVRHYLVLLILHSLGYRGSYRNLMKTQGWVGDMAVVPWT